MGNRQDMTAEKQSLKDKLMAIILLETTKDYREMDSDLVTECVDFLMELEGKQRLAKAEIEQRVNEIPFKGKVTAIGSYAKKKIRAKRLAVIAAVLAFIVALFGIIAVSSGKASSELHRNLGKTIIEMFGGEVAEYGNITLIKPTETKTYSSIETLIRDEKLNFLYPTWLPENEKITSVSYWAEEQSETYVLQCDNDNYSISVTINKVVAEVTKSNCLTRKINEFTVYYIEQDVFAQGIFEYKNNYYIVKSDTEENLFKTIECLEEIN